MNLIKIGIVLLLIGILIASFSDVIAEDLLGFERSFGEEPISIKLVRGGLLTSLLGVVLMLWGAVKNKKAG